MIIFDLCYFFSCCCYFLL